METLIEIVFDKLQAEIHRELATVKTQMVHILSSANHTAHPSEDFKAIRAAMDAIQSRLAKMETRLQVLEVTQVNVASPIPNSSSTSAGLEGLLLQPLTLPSPALSARSENQIVLPRVLKQIVIQEEEEEEEEVVEEVEPDEEAVQAVVAEETGGQVDEEEVIEEQGEQEEEQEEEEEEAETIELEEFDWKGKTYFKTPDHFVYRANEDGDVEDEPFAKFDPKTNTLKRV